MEEFLEKIPDRSIIHGFHTLEHFWVIGLTPVQAKLEFHHWVCSKGHVISAEQGAIALKQAYLSNLINLYKVMGGGKMDASNAN